MFKRIPEDGQSEDEILGYLDSIREGDVDWRKGRAFALVYSSNDEHEEVLKKAHARFFSDNALNPLAFASSRKLELQTVRMAANLFHGGPDAVGAVTTGGTESILLAVKAARELARSKRSMSTPNMVVPETAHVAFDKAGSYFDVEVRYARVRDDYRVDVNDVRKLTNRNTILLVGSAPQYVQGVIDPIQDLSDFALKREIPLHVDACVGGYVLPFLEQIGERVPLWDFRVPGVTSISADLHKYGFASKGSSSILYRNMDYFKHQFFVSTDWSGGIYAGTTMLGTRSAAPIAAAWASLVHLGVEGFQERAKRMLSARKKLEKAIAERKELEVVGDPDATLVSFRTTERSGIGTVALSEQLENRGWHNDRHQNPAAIHCTIMPHHDEVMAEFIADVDASLDFLRSGSEPNKESYAAMYGLMAKIPMRGMVRDSVMDAMEFLYGPEALDSEETDPLASREDEKWHQRLTKEFAPQINDALDRFSQLKDKLPTRFRRPRQKVKR